MHGMSPSHEPVLVRRLVELDYDLVSSVLSLRLNNYKCDVVTCDNDQSKIHRDLRQSS